MSCSPILIPVPTITSTGQLDSVRSELCTDLDPGTDFTSTGQLDSVRSELFTDLGTDNQCRGGAPKLTARKESPIDQQGNRPEKSQRGQLKPATDFSRNAQLITEEIRRKSTVTSRVR